MNRLIIFTRYPKPGQTKTRLIPILGAEGAASLQRQMTEKTLIKAQQLLQIQPISIEIRYTGTDLSKMKAWLGNNLSYQKQGEGDLGMKMLQGFKDAFESGYQKVITIGIDCPDLTAEILNQAFTKLDHSELVIGPAIDGGYYLIGLNRLIPELFKNINWGTDQVWSKTQKIAQNLDLNLSTLPILQDIDRPEDLSSINLSNGEQKNFSSISQQT